MFKIGDFSKLSFVSIRMLRYYDEVGIFKPIKVDTFTGFRYYSANQLPIIYQIVELRDLGFNVSEINQYLNEDSKQKKEMLLQKKLQEIESNIATEQFKYEKIKFVIQNIHKEKKNMNYEVKIKSVPSYNMLALREAIPAYDREGDLWSKLGEYMKQNGITPKQNGICFAAYYDETKLESGVDVEVLQEVDELGKASAPFEFRTTNPLACVASIMITGPYTNIAPAFTFLGAWLEENDHQIVGSPRQIPFKGPWNETDPNNYLTEIQIPIK